MAINIFTPPNKTTEPITASLSACYRLCVCASGSWITDILSCFTLISVSCLHFGQNSGKCSSTVSSRNFIRVLLLQTGHNSHCVFIISSNFHSAFVAASCGGKSHRFASIPPALPVRRRFRLKAPLLYPRRLQYAYDGR